MEIKISDLQELISKEKQVAGISMYGAFKDGFIAAWDILNTYLKTKMPKCVNCQKVLSEEEYKESDTCDECYRKAQDEAYNERKRNEP